MATLKIAYATAAAFTISADGLANNGARQSTAVDNTTNLYLDALVRCKLQTATGSLAATPTVEIWVYSLSYGGANYADPAGASDAAITMPTVPNFRLLDVVTIRAANTVQYTMERSVAALFDGVMPDKWGIILVNKSGLALSGTAGQGTVVLAEMVGITGSSA